MADASGSAIPGKGQALNSFSSEQMVAELYSELRRLASAKMGKLAPGQTLQATALVHEAYLRLVGGGVGRVQGSGFSEEAADRGQETGDRGQKWDSRGHFFAAAAEAMRRIIVDQARHKATIRAGGQLQRVELSEVEPMIDGPTLDILALNEALHKLEQKDPRKAELIKLRFFAGLSNQQAAEVLGIAASTADLDWAYARSWLHVEMSGDRRRNS